MAEYASVSNFKSNIVWNRLKNKQKWHSLRQSTLSIKDIGDHFPTFNMQLISNPMASVFTFRAFPIRFEAISIGSSFDQSQISYLHTARLFQIHSTFPKAWTALFKTHRIDFKESSYRIHLALLMNLWIIIQSALQKIEENQGIGSRCYSSIDMGKPPLRKSSAMAVWCHWYLAHM